MDDVIAVLQQAKERLAVVGWTRRREEDDAGRNCMLGAIKAVLGLPYADIKTEPIVVFEGKVVMTETDRLFLRVVQALRDTAHPISHGWFESLTTHNDDCLRSAGDALDWVDRAITHAKDKAAQ